jgi:hypothetical protein
MSVPGPRPDRHVQRAARDNAEWCDTMCRAHGLPGTFTDRAWTNPARTPPYYPDAVTLSPEATAADVLGRIDAGPGASVKDSFAALDLPGFDVLFEARWIHHPAPAAIPTPVAWEVVADATALTEWERAWGGCAPAGLFRPALLAEATVLAGRIGGDLVCGSVLTPRERVIGVSNVYAAACDPAFAWAGTIAMAATLHPGRPLVGYERDPSDAVAHGFTTTGPLRVWLKS